MSTSTHTSNPFTRINIFPCFDQPDLKATFKTTVTAPNDWKVISNYPLKTKKTTESGAEHSFQTTRKIPTYVVALAVGPYEEWLDPKDKTQKLYARKTMAKYVDSESWFKTLSDGKKFFRSFFGHGMPYPKYDQIIVPDFNAGAMENVGAVTFSERFIFRSAPTRDQLRKRAEVILHELAHMWFGNWVTMDWWDGLWLNESFATFTAIHSLEPVSGFSDAWLSFNTQRKSSAYFEDAITATHHPVQGPVQSTDQAFANFDSITYGKGASVLKQLVFTIGEKSFSKGLQHYFAKFQDSNATMGDFFKSMEWASGKKLQEWQKLWIETSGFDQIKVTQNCGPTDQLGHWKLELVSDQPTPRPHRFLVKTKNGKKSESTSVELNSKKKTQELRMYKNCDSFILVNEGDHGYFSVSLPEPLIYENQLQDELDQAVQQQGLWLSWLQGSFKTNSFFQYIDRQIQNETETTLLRRWFSILLASDLSVFDTLNAKHQKRAFDLIQQKAFNLIESDFPDDLKWLGIEWISHTDFSNLDSSTQKQARQKIENALKTGKLGDIDLKTDTDRRWSLIRSLCRSGFSNCEKEVTQQLEADTTLNGRRQAFSILTEQPSLSLKKKWIEALLGSKQKSVFTKLEPPYSEADIKTALGGMIPYGFNTRFGDETAFAAEYLKNFVREGRDHTFTRRIADELYPRNCQAQRSKAETTWWDAFKTDALSEGLPGPAMKAIRTQEFLNRQCSKIKEN